MDQTASGHMSRAHSLATALSEGLVSVSSKSLASHIQPTAQASSRRSLDRGGSR